MILIRPTPDDSLALDDSTEQIDPAELAITQSMMEEADQRNDCLSCGTQTTDLGECPEGCTESMDYYVQSSYGNGLTPWRKVRHDVTWH